MAHTINLVFGYVQKNPGFRPSLGVIVSSSQEKTILAWGAHNPSTDELWVPELADIKVSWPDAKWTPMSQQQASLFDSAYEREQKPREDWLLSI